jgi:antitoxin component YwqK of YwqJK toxin-antitoxin module
MKKIFITLFLALTLIGCKTSSINQKENKKKVGLWIEEYSIDTTKYKSVGKYKKGDPTRKWLYYTNNTITKKEIYRKNKCIITNYNANGTIESQGKTKLVVTGPETHWFYYGDWKYYDKNGKLLTVRKYDNGQFISETKMQLYTKEETATIKK